MRLLLLQHYEYELNVPLAALGACVEDRHITDTLPALPSVDKGNLLFSLSD
jgi:hypothetical protein